MEIAALAYSVVTATRPHVWVRFAEDIAGFAAVEVPGGTALRLDERAGRVFVVSGAEDGYFATGWELRSRIQFEKALEDLAAKGVTFTHGTGAECALRHVSAMVWLADPAGNRHELSWGPVSTFQPFRSPQGVDRFVTGDLGYGHVVLPAPAIDATRDFLVDVLGLGVSDFMVHRPLGPGGPAMRIDFMHCANARHHSLALFEGPVPAGCVHMMVEVPTLDDVGRAHDRVLRSGARMMATLGKHTNDHMTSFYVMTPGGFALEYGFGGLQLDWDRHTEFEFTEVSLWGHDFSVGFGADEKAAMADAA
ncbi:Glyoxalase/bleomycin resistance protein/dioxygenase (plasmid) [Novosphingobium aromaticivorans DSM 12444]|uniref:Glyoxalase/bleomycin resistance protein/dioxygenase n=1 Tax=Novosphingobium aromaticivorans (strain ATCC 700278 / DSM 12444 / CCUG 56034 / CIP 105152 / NBRC 16084 / F199) TaxID=279238 RepID=A4XEZ5_NOVAD|nr:VOC family protein [Novosphingobium aromaticivorans]ABP64506.1 Glyoxalase/bleomycin resistance protein/dioxygenase [Novosphingobium aromaticivorans DSM 12444]SCY92823.1 3,4-dihydroxy-9,10-secoandrosta-1,3,5(10)-triene-9,17-dione 4,5-dioxygenase [Novosphingobium aromaticivorans]